MQNLTCTRELKKSEMKLEVILYAFTVINTGFKEQTYSRGYMIVGRHRAKYRRRR